MIFASVVGWRTSFEKGLVFVGCCCWGIDLYHVLLEKAGWMAGLV